MLMVPLIAHSWISSNAGESLMDCSCFWRLFPISWKHIWHLSPYNFSHSLQHFMLGVQCSHTLQMQGFDVFLHISYKWCSPPLRLYCGVNGLAADPSSKFDKDWRRINLPAAPPQDRVDRGAAHYKYQKCKNKETQGYKITKKKKIIREGLIFCCLRMESRGCSHCKYTLPQIFRRLSHSALRNKHEETS